MTKIRFIKTSTVYSNYLETLYQNQPELKIASYNDQIRAIVSDFYGWADFWKLNLEKIGSYEAEEIFINAEYLQKQWAVENNIQYSDRKWLLDILQAQLINFKPDIWFSHDAGLIPPGFRKMIKDELPHLKLILGWDGTCVMQFDKYKECDIVLSCIEKATKYYQKYKPLKGYTFYHGFEPGILNEINRHALKHDVSFIGSVPLKDGAHNERRRLIQALLENMHISLWIAGIGNIEKSQISNNLYRIIDNNRGEVFGRRMFQILADSKITLNTHIDKVGDNAVNMRLFEATGMGTCLVTDWKSNLADLFIPDKEVVTYKSSQEAIEKINYLLCHEKERESIAKAGQMRTLKDHNLYGRIKQLSDRLQKYLN